MTAVATKEIPSLNGFRAVGVGLVLVGHAGFGKIVPGGLGVTIFFFLSGYLITTLLLEEYDKKGCIDLRKFYLRRAIRLLPPLAVVLIVAYALVFVGLLEGGFSWGGMLAQALYFANYWQIFWRSSGEIPSGTGILWSLAVEEHFYIFYPVILIFLLGALKRRLVAYALLGICALVLLWRIYLSTRVGFFPDRTYLASDTRVDSIFFGCVLATGWPALKSGKDEQGPSWRLPIFALIGLSVILVSLMFRNLFFRETFRYTIQGLALMPIFSLAIDRPSFFTVRFLNWSVVRRLGVLSYNIYLSHYIVIHCIERAFPSVQNPAVMLILAGAIAVGYSMAVERYIEVQFLALRHRLH